MPYHLFFLRLAGLVLMGQSEFHQLGLNCPTQGFLLQVFYLQMNLWHTMTVVTMYRMVETGSPKFKGKKMLGIRLRTWIHFTCWIIPFILAGIMMFIERTPFHDDFEFGGETVSGVWADHKDYGSGGRTTASDGMRGIGS